MEETGTERGTDFIIIIIIILLLSSSSSSLSLTIMFLSYFNVEGRMSSL